MIDYKTIGARIRAIRNARKMTQEQLAEAVGVGVTHISHIETGKTKLSVQCLLDIANALHVSVDELVCGYNTASSVILDQEIKELLDDCTPQEKQIILETMKSLKSSLRKSSNT